MPSLTLPCAHCGRTTPHRRKGFGFRAKRRVQQYQCGVCGTIQTEKRKEIAR